MGFVGAWGIFNILVLTLSIVATILIFIWVYKIMRFSKSNNKLLKEIITYITKEDFPNKH